MSNFALCCFNRCFSQNRCTFREDVNYKYENLIIYNVLIKIDQTFNILSRKNTYPVIRNCKCNKRITKCYLFITTQKSAWRTWLFINNIFIALISFVLFSTYFQSDNASPWHKIVLRAISGHVRYINMLLTRSPFLWVVLCT